MSDSYQTKPENFSSWIKRRQRGLWILFLASFIVWGLATLVIRLHVTRLAYEFESLKRYHRSLKEEQLRLRADLAEKLSINQIQSSEFHEPQPDQVVRLP